MNHEDFVTYEQAVKLKELGFNWKCRYFYDERDKLPLPFTEMITSFEGDFKDVTSDTMLEDFNKCTGIYSSPTLAQIQKWLYEKYELWIEVTIKAKNDFTLCIVNNFGSIKFINDKEYTDLRTPEQALSAGIDKALELLKEKK